MITVRIAPGFTLVELMVAMGVAAFMLTGLLTVVQAASASFRLQQGVSTVHESAHFALTTIASDVQAAGYRPEPWDDGQALPAVSSESENAVTPQSDRLVVQRWSRLNCFDNPNPQTDASGRPRLDLRVTRFEINGTGNLAMTCRYGPAPGQMTTQVNNLGLVEHAESFQVQFAEDAPKDGNANRWIRAGQWQDQNRLLGVRFALLLASPTRLGDIPSGTHQVLEEFVAPEPDGRLRRVVQTTVAFQGQLR